VLTVLPIPSSVRLPDFASWYAASLASASVNPNNPEFDAV
jgi:hypothetical protein